MMKIRSKISYIAFINTQTINELFYERIIKTHSQLQECGDIKVCAMDQMRSKAIIKLISTDKAGLVNFIDAINLKSITDQKQGKVEVVTYTDSNGDTRKKIIDNFTGHMLVNEMAQILDKS
jgi:hypothetical protein